MVYQQDFGLRLHLPVPLTVLLDGAGDTTADIEIARCGQYGDNIVRLQAQRLQSQGNGFTGVDRNDGIVIILKKKIQCRTVLFRYLAVGKSMLRPERAYFVMRQQINIRIKNNIVYELHT